MTMKLSMFLLKLNKWICSVWKMCFWIGNGDFKHLEWTNEKIPLFLRSAKTIWFNCSISDFCPFIRSASCSTQASSVKEGTKELKRGIKVYHSPTLSFFIGAILLLFLHNDELACLCPIGGPLWLILSKIYALLNQEQYRKISSKHQSSRLKLEITGNCLSVFTTLPSSEEAITL